MLPNRLRSVLGLALLTLQASCGARVRAPSASVADLYTEARIALHAADTATAVALLDSVVRIDDQHASAWHLRGMLYWNLSRHHRSSILMQSQAAIEGLVQADRSLRSAAALAPDSAVFALDLGRFFLFADLITLRIQAPAQFRKAVAAAEASYDSSTAATALDEWGMIYWRRYETLAHRRTIIDSDGLQIASVLDNGRAVAHFIDRRTRPVVPPPGAEDLKRALSLFSRAVHLDRRNTRAWKHRFMVHAERADWSALAETAHAAERSGVDRATTQLALGLALQRQGHFEAANLAFDRALAAMSDVDRGRASSLARILTENDSSTLKSTIAREAPGFEAAFWITADPLFLTPGNELRSEYFARYAFAQLRWTSEDFGLPGADSDRGLIHIRYGPPSVIASFAPQTTESMTCEASEGYTQRTELAGLRCSDDKTTGNHFVLWSYRELGLHFVFRSPPTYGVAKLTPEFLSVAEDVRKIAPSAWVNLPTAKFAVDSVDVQLNRFRAPGDSSDVIVFAAFDQSLWCDKGSQRMTLLQGFTASRLDGAVVFADTGTVTRHCEAKGSSSLRSWRFRSSRGPLVYRAEALSRERKRAARALGFTQLGAGIGFDISDVVVAARVAPKPNREPKSWSDFDIDPAASVFASGQPISLMWETYWLAEKDNFVRYQVSISVERADSGAGAPLNARIIRGIRTAVGLQERGEERVVLTYERDTRASSTVVDYVTLDVGSLQSGQYVITVRVEDRNSPGYRVRTRQFAVQ